MGAKSFDVGKRVKYIGAGACAGMEGTVRSIEMMGDGTYVLIVEMGVGLWTCSPKDVVLAPAQWVPPYEKHREALASLHRMAETIQRYRISVPYGTRVMVERGLMKDDHDRIDATPYGPIAAARDVRRDPS